MKKNMKAISTKILVLTFGIGALTSCISDKDSPGLDFMPDMYRSPAIEPYVDYGWIKDRTVVELTMKQSAKHPPMHTVPYHGDIEDLEMYLPYNRLANSFAAKTHNLMAKDGWKLSDQPGGDYFKSAEDKNPLVLTAENEKEIFDTGKKLFTINCAHCHGKEGDGKGPMVESGAYAGVPDFNNLLELKDGQVFFSIYYGKGMMGAHAPFMSNKEIWTVVHYINKLRFKDYGAGFAAGETAADEATEEVADETAENTED